MSLRVIEELRSHGHQAYWVGGCVRDSLLNRPVKDRDVATSALPQQIVDLFPHSRLVGARFGVVMVPDDDQLVEVATFRSDNEYIDGRRPESVTFSQDATVDVRRRDFTINGMLCDAVSGEVLDYVGGQEDLSKQLVRTIGSPEKRFSEDWLRMLRAVRFAASLDFEIEDQTLAAIRQYAHRSVQIAPERIREELGRILIEGKARRGFELLFDSGLLIHLLPEVVALRGVMQPPEFHPEGDVWIHTMLMLDGLENPSRPLAWAVLFHDIGKPGTLSVSDRIHFYGHVRHGVGIAENICQRLQFSNAEKERVLTLVANHMKFREAKRMRLAKLQRFIRLPYFEEHLELHRLDCISSHGQLKTYDFVREQYRQSREHPPNLKLLTGEDLKEAGYRPGPLYAKILELVEDQELEGKLESKQQALDYVRERFPN